MKLPKIVPLLMDEVFVPEDRRALNPERLAVLKASMQDIGLMTPITCQFRDGIEIEGTKVDGVAVLVAGRHRLKSAEDLGWHEIDAYIIEGDEIDAGLWECDENLARADLSPVERIDQTERRARFWTSAKERDEKSEQLQTDKSGPTMATLSDRPKTGRGNKQFAADTEDKTGQPKSTTNLALHRAAKVPADVRRMVVGTALDTGAYIDKLGVLSHDEQRTKARADVKALKTKPQRQRLTHEERYTKQLKRLQTAWKAADQPAQHAFLKWLDSDDAPVFDKTRAA